VERPEGAASDGLAVDAPCHDEPRPPGADIIGIK
jgi:hypothetical protein